MKNNTLRLRLWLIVILTFGAILYLLPSVMKEPPGFLPGNKIRLGLDLQGGTHLVLTVRVDKAVENITDRMIDRLRADLSEGGVRVISAEREGESGIRLAVPPEVREKVKEIIAKEFPTLELKETASQDAHWLFRFALAPDEALQIKENAVEQSLETIRNRVDQFGVTEPVIARQGQQDILVQLPGVQDPNRAKDLIGKTALLEFKLVREGVNPSDYVDNKKPLPAGTELLFSPPEQGRVPYVVEKRAFMTGDSLTDARVQTGEMPNEWVVGFTFNAEGGRIFEKITAANVGKRIAIVLDGKVQSAPVIKTRIPGGRGIIEGNFKVEEAKDLAIVLRSGALPAPVEFAEERTVGPSLGRDSIQQGFLSFMVGGAIVIIFMIAYYRGAGLLADTALLLNVILLLGTLAAFEATLTLPGIAGIVLTLGMAVDANVLINERIREELRLGKSIRAAIDAGYERALPAILDSNITTFLAGVILFQFGSGPIKGFAVTLCIGLVSTIFTAVVFTRTVYDFLLSRGMGTPGVSGIELIASAPSFDFIRLRNRAILGSVVAIGIGFAVLIPRGGPNWGIDFAGGSMVHVRLAQQTPIQYVRDSLKELNLASDAVQDIGGSGREYLIRLPMSPDEMERITRSVTDKLKERFGSDQAEILRVEAVGPRVGKKLRDKAVLAVLFSTVMMGVYIWFRFEWRFGIGAAVALVHDVLITLGALFLFDYELDLTIVAALLTIVGFSVNDTVVVSDRIRENMRKDRRSGLAAIINRSINETLSRTILTSGTALMTVLALFVLGGNVIHGFAFSLLVGFIAGVYSSIYIASPVVLFFEGRRLAAVRR